MNCDNETVTDVIRWRKENARYGRQNEIVERQYLKKIRYGFEFVALCCHIHKRVLK